MRRLRRWAVKKLGGQTVFYFNGLPSRHMEDVWAAVVIGDDYEAVLFMLVEPPETWDCPPEHRDKPFWAPMVWPSEELAREGLGRLKDVLALLDGQDIALRRYGPFDFVEWVRKA